MSNHSVQSSNAESFGLDFDFQLRTRIVSGNHSSQRIGEIAREYATNTVLLVTDTGLVNAGHASLIQNSLEHYGLKVILFDRVEENPTTRCVQKCVELAQSKDIELIIGLGGGSSMDTAKGCNFILTNGGSMKDYWGVGKASKPMLPFIAIPTTAGTGSEMQSAALIADEFTHQKMACLDTKATARVALLDPALTVSQPQRVTACAGIDAIAHALETAVTRRRTPISSVYSDAAFSLAVRAFPMVLTDPQNIQARGEMLLAAAYAGIAIEQSMLGAAHAAANPLTAHCSLIHGQAVGIMLPGIIKFNAVDPVVKKTYVRLALQAGISNQADDEDQAVGGLIRKIEELLSLAKLPRSLNESGVPSSMIPILAEEAARQWTASFNPVPVNSGQFIKLYEDKLLIGIS